VYQQDVQGSYDGRTAGMCGEAVMAKSRDGVGEATMAILISHKMGLLVGCNAHTGGETSVGTLQASGNH
jgi:hypothetical protein